MEQSKAAGAKGARSKGPKGGKWTKEEVSRSVMQSINPMLGSAKLRHEVVIQKSGLVCSNIGHCGLLTVWFEFTIKYWKGFYRKAYR